MSIKKIIKIFRREGSKGGSRVEGELVNDVSGDELVEGSLESAITDSSVRKVPDQTLLTLKVRDLHLPAEPCLPASEHLDKNQPQSKFSRDVPVQQRQQQVASFRRSRVLTSLTTNQFSSLATEEDGLPAAFSPRARRMSCPSVSSPEVGRLHAPTSTLSTKNKLPIVRPRSIIRPTARALPTPSLARQRSPSLIADDSDIQAHMEQYISEPPVSDRSPPQSKVLGNSSIDEFKPRRSTGRRLSCPNVDVSHFYNPDVPAVESPILSPLIKHRDGISKTPGIPISPRSGVARARPLLLTSIVHDSTIAPLQTTRTQETKRKPPSTWRKLSEYGRRPTCPIKFRNIARRNTFARRNTSIESALKKRTHLMVTERGVTDNHSPVIGSVVSSTPKPQPQGYDDKGIDDTDIFRRKVHKRRVKFLNSHTVHHTFCADEYDRSKPPQREEDIEPIMTVYRELMKYKITEMVVHQDALQYTNHHLSRRDEAAHNIMMGTIRAIISEFTE